MTDCHCGSGRSFADCCGPYLSGEALPPTAEALMRSRYSAFCTRNVDYLHDTLLPSTRHDFNREHVAEWAANSQWTGLEVRRAVKGGADDTDGDVEFVARFTVKGENYVHHETGTFAKEDGRWYYVDGIMGQKPRTAPKVGRNDPCTCGSGKKYKKCCGAAA